MFQNSVTKGVNSLKAEWLQDKSWPTLGPTQFQTQTVKVPSIACFDLKKEFTQSVLVFKFPQQCFQQAPWWHDFCRCSDIFSSSDFRLARRKKCSLEQSYFFVCTVKIPFIYIEVMSFKTFWKISSELELSLAFLRLTKKLHKKCWFEKQQKQQAVAKRMALAIASSVINIFLQRFIPIKKRDKQTLEAETCH